MTPETDMDVILAALNNLKRSSESMSQNATRVFEHTDRCIEKVFELERRILRLELLAHNHTPTEGTSQCPTT